MYNNLFSIGLGYTPSGKQTNKKLNKYKNDYVFANELIRNVTDALHRYKIEGIPDTCSERVIMQSLLYYGFVFFFERQGNLLALPGNPDGSGLNAYGDFAGAYVYGANGYNERVNVYLPGSDEASFLSKTINGQKTRDYHAVMVRENELLYPFIRQTVYYSERMADTLRKIETATLNSAVPYVVTAEESIVNTVREYFNKRDNNEAYIISSGIFPADKIEIMPFDIQPQSITALTGVYDWLANHYRELCATRSSTNLDKKGENLLSAEIHIGDDYTQGQGDKILECLQSGLDDCNKIFGTNMSVIVEEVTEGENISVDEDGAESVSGDDTGGPAD